MINEVGLAIVFPYAQQTTLMLINVDCIFDCKAILNDS